MININELLGGGTGKYNSKTINKKIENFYKTNQIFDRSSLIITLIYLKRYSETTDIRTTKDILKLLESCLILSNKFICDLEIKDSGLLENEIIKKLNWNLFISEEEFNRYRTIVEVY
jgi:hypothetical protein